VQGYNFTLHVRAALAKSREEAVRLRHEYVGTEHLLLGLLNSEAGVAMRVIESFKVDPKRIEARIEEVVTRGQVPHEPRPDLPYTSRAKTVLELAMDEARVAEHSYVGTEHLLLGLIRERKGIAAQLLADSGITLEPARERVHEILRESELQNERHSQARTGPATSKSWPKAPPRGDDAHGASLRMAALIIETLVRDAGVASVFANQGIDAAALAAALRDVARQRPPDAAPGNSASESPTPPSDTPPPA